MFFCFFLLLFVMTGKWCDAFDVSAYSHAEFKMTSFGGEEKKNKAGWGFLQD